MSRVGQLYRRGKTTNNRFYTITHESMLGSLNEVSDLYYLVQLLDSGSKDVAVDLPIILGSDKFLRLIEYYGGQSIPIPTIEGIQEGLIGVMAYYYHDIKSEPWNKVLDILNMPRTSSNKRIVTNRYNKVKELLSNDLPRIPSKPTKDDPVDINDVPILVRCDDSNIVRSRDYNSSITTFLNELLESGKITEDQLAEYIDGALV